jgi:vacuolar-type H+-ATPase subunit I/STV1
MLRPEEMTRVVVVGSIDSLDATIECLYELGAMHLIDFTKQDEEFRIGQPLSKASEASQKLLKLRSMIRTLEIEEHKPGERLSIESINKEMEQALVTLDLNTSRRCRLSFERRKPRSKPSPPSEGLASLSRITRTMTAFRLSLAPVELIRHQHSNRL